MLILLIPKRIKISRKSNQWVVSPCLQLSHGFDDVLSTHSVAFLANGAVDGLIDQILQVSTAPRLRSQRHFVDDIGGNLIAAALGGYQLAENTLPLLQAGQIHWHLYVKPTSTEDGVIDQVYAIGGCYYDYAVRGGKAVHFTEELVNRGSSLV
jgi:hypothetical protein